MRSQIDAELLRADAKAGGAVVGGGAARRLARLARDAAAFWVQLAVVRLDALLAYACGDGGGSACRLLASARVRLQARLQRWRGGGEAEAEGQAAEEMEEEGGNASGWGSSAEPREMKSPMTDLAEGPAAELFNLLLGSM